MLKNRHGEPGYVRRVQEDTKRYVEGLFKENETLRTLLARLRSEKLALEEQVLVIREQLDRHRQERVRLQRQIADIEADHQRFRQDYDAIELQSSNLANLYVASYRLHGTLDREEVLTTLLEILINLVGTEEVGVFELNQEENRLELVTSHGIDEARYQTVPLGEGILGRVAATGEPYFGGGEKAEDGDDAGITACIALQIDGSVTGVITVFSLLPHKPGLELLDHEIFELLATHAATALYCTKLYARVTEKVSVT